MHFVADAELHDVTIPLQHLQNLLIRYLIDAERRLRDMQHFMIKTVLCGVRDARGWRSVHTLGYNYSMRRRVRATDLRADYDRVRAHADCSRAESFERFRARKGCNHN